MGIEDEVRLFKQLTDNVKIAIDETYDNLFACEENVDKLLKHAPCVFSYNEFMLLLAKRDEFYLRVGQFERMASKLSRLPIIMDTMDVLEIQATMMKINESFEELGSFVQQFNVRFESDQFSIDKFILLQKVSDFGLEYDTVDYMELDELICNQGNMFYVLRVKDCFDTDYDKNYGDMHVLSVKGFNTRVEANLYALKHGISRDYIKTRL